MKTVLISIALLMHFQPNAQQVEHIKIKSLRSKPIVQATINGKKGFFLVDTGSDISVINSSQLEKYQLKDKTIYGNDRHAQGVGGRRVEVKKVNKVLVALTENFAHSNFYSINIDCIAKSLESKTTYRVVGIIGADILLKYNCIIDYNQRRITMVNNRSIRRIAAK